MFGDLTINVILLNVAFTGNLIAMYVASQVRLRLLLIFFQTVTIYRAYFYLQDFNLVGWFAVFLSLNSYRLIRLYLDSREVRVPEELRDLKEMVFNSMTPREFLLFWEKGLEVVRGVGDPLVIEGEENDRLILILDGEADVRVKDSTTVAQNFRGDFVGEMSLITKNPASATVLAAQPAICREWAAESLEALKEKYNPIYQKLQGAMGRNIVEKLVSANQRIVDSISFLSRGLDFSEKKTISNGDKETTKGEIFEPGMIKSALDMLDVLKKGGKVGNTSEERTESSKTKVKSSKKFWLNIMGKGD